MSEQQTRQALYARIQETSKDEVILDEMIRLGFWRPDEDPQSAELTALQRRRGETQRELSRIWSQGAALSDPERALKTLNEERKAAARARRRETKLARARDRQDRAEAWAAKSKDTIWHLGEGVSVALGPKGAPATKALVAPGLPDLPDPAAIAAAMGAPVGELRFLAYMRPLSRVSHYRRFTIPKKTGGARLISAPMPRLKFAQYWLLDAVLAKVPVHEAAHGFVPGRSILTNARPHVGRDVVINLDLKDFFPSIDDRRVKGLFQGLGYYEATAQTLALIATEPDADEIEIDGKRAWIARGGRRRLPQGAPSSPAITNLLCRRLDRRLSGLARKLGFTYTRYADDLTFSTSGEPARKVGTLLRAVRDVVRAEGFELHPDKTRVMRKGARQEVTGLVVNERLGVPRAAIRKARAALHRASSRGLASMRFGSGRNPLAALRGFAQFVAMLDKAQGDDLKRRVMALEAGPGGAEARAHPPGPMSRSALRAAAARGALPEGWRWRPAERKAPPLDPVLAEARKEEERRAARAAAQAARAQSQPRSAVPNAGSQRAREAARWNAPPPRGPSRGALWARFIALVIVTLAIIPVAGALAAIPAYFAWRTWRRL